MYVQSAWDTLVSSTVRTQRSEVVTCDEKELDLDYKQNIQFGSSFDNVPD